MMLTNLIVVVALGLFHEGSICDKAELRAIGSTLWVRSTARPGKRFDEMDLFYTLTAPAQYSCVRDRLLDTPGHAVPGDADPMWRYCLQLSRALVTAARTGKTDAFKCGPQTHYYLKSMRDPPEWAKHMTQVDDSHRYHRFGVCP